MRGYWCLYPFQRQSAFERGLRALANTQRFEGSWIYGRRDCGFGIVSHNEEDFAHAFIANVDTGAYRGEIDCDGGSAILRNAST